MNATGTVTEFREIDQLEYGVGWIAQPDEYMQRSSHALVHEDDVWIIEPVDADGLDDLFDEHGDVAGVVVLMDRHKRDAARIANRHDVSVHLPEFMGGLADEIEAPIELFQRELGETGYAAHPIVENLAWKEAVLYGEETDVLLVPEALGTAEHFLAGDERIGVHPILRLTPPHKLTRLRPEHILVGHGRGIHEHANRRLETAIKTARKRIPALYAENLRRLLPI